MRHNRSLLDKRDTVARRGQDIRLCRPNSDNTMLYDPEVRLREYHHWNTDSVMQFRPLLYFKILQQ